MNNSNVISLLLNVVIIALVFYSIIIHEFSHSLAAFLLGDDSAKRAGRLTLNPLKHIDWFGTVILPLFLYLTCGFIYGYAKPVPFNPYNFKNFKTDSGLTGLAGPLSNFLVAIVFALIYHLFGFSFIVQYICTYVIYLNLLLAFFNLIPIPPLDGSKVIGIFLTDQAYYKWTMQERKGMIYLFAFIIISSLLGWNIIGKIIVPPVNFIMNLMGVH
ncbi:MAG TPA: site-2 protease family protein [Candidatus Cloacimonas sp.]|nr:site-2 protease family protein [Candidatus Cloacimonas sp.]